MTSYTNAHPRSWTLRTFTEVFAVAIEMRVAQTGSNLRGRVTRDEYLCSQVVEAPEVLPGTLKPGIGQDRIARGRCRLRNALS